MKFTSVKLFLSASLLFISSLANAGLIVKYDILTATSAPNLVGSFVGANYSASDLVVNGVTDDGGFGNHFYHLGWDDEFNSTKFYNLTLSNLNPFELSYLEFSLENISGSSTYWLRSSLDGFVSDISSGIFSDGLVTDFSVDLTSLTTIIAPIEFRWYIASSTKAGFANHQCKPIGSELFDNGCNLEDVGVDLAIFDIPEPSIFTIFAIGMIGLVSRKFKKQF